MLLFGDRHVLVDRHQAFNRVSDIGRQRCEHRRNPVAERPRLVGASNGNGHRGDQRSFGDLVDVPQVVAQSASTYGHHHIVHRRSEGRLDELHCVERHLHVLEMPVRGQRGVERGTRRLKQGRWPNAIAVVVLHGPQAGDRGSRDLGESPRLLDERAQGTERQHRL